MNTVAPIAITTTLIGGLLYLSAGLLVGGLDAYRSFEWLWPVLLFVAPAIVCPERWRTRLVAGAIVVLSGLAVYSFGLAAIAGVLLFFLGAFAAGSRLRALIARAPLQDVISLDLPLGLCVCVAIFGLASRFAYLDRHIVALLLVLAVWFGREAVQSAAVKTVADAKTRLEALSRKEAVAAAFMFAITAFVALGCFLPTVGYDDHAYHLRPWTELAASGRISLDPVHHIFSLAPFAVDLLYALPSLMAGEDTRGVVNLVLLVLIAKDLYLAARAIPLPESLRLLGVALFVSTPLLLLATTTLQTEMWATFLTTRFAGIVIRDRRGPLIIFALECLALAALLAATKLTGALLGALMLAAALARLRDTERASPGAGPALGWAGVALGLLVVVALQSYATAWMISGNPVFPFFNGIFKSRFFEPVNFTNVLFTKHNSVAGFIGMFWNTHEYLEARDGVAGFQYLFVLPLAAVALLIPGRRSARLIGLFLAALVYTIVSFSSQQYVRYLLPVMPAATLLLLAAFPASWPAGRNSSHLQGAAALAFCILISLLNVTFAKGAIWYLGTQLTKKILPQQRLAYLEAHMPEWRANAFVNAQAGAAARVFYDGPRPYGATLAGIPILPNWYNPTLERAVPTAGTADDVGSLFSRFGVTHVFWDTAWAGEMKMPATPYRRALADYLAIHGKPLARFGRIDVYAVDAATSPPATIFNLADSSDFAKLAPVPDKPALRVNATDRVFRAEVPRDNVSVLKVETQFACEEKAVFLVQINWDAVPAPAHYRPVICSPGRVNDFVDVVQVPPRARTMTVYFNTHVSSRAPVEIQRYVIRGR